MKQHQHNRKSLRLRDYNYSESGAYFVTICTKTRESYFKKFPNLQTVVHSQWNALTNRFPQIQLDEFIIMPNHIHGIIFIIGTNDVSGGGAIHESSLQSRQSRRNKLLPKVIGYFKMNSAKQTNQILNRPGQSFWQRNYYEHVVRNEKELKKIREYILNNPLKWELDRENPKSKSFNLDHDLYWREVYCRGNS